MPELRLGSRTFACDADSFIEAGMAFFALSLFSPGMTALGNTGLGVAFLLTLAGGRWRALAAVLRRPPLVLLLLLVLAFFLSTLWSVNPAETWHSALKRFGDYVWLAFPLAYLLADSGRALRFARVLAWCGVAIAALNAELYLSDYIEDPASLLVINSHRGWGEPLNLFMPFALLQARTVERGEARWWWLLLLVQAVMVLATGARGAWLAMAASLAVWMAFDCTRKEITAGLAALAALGAIAVVALPEGLVMDRLQQGFDTSLRMGGTWGPSIEMMNERPLTGFGFGRQIYHDQFNARAPGREHWQFKQSLGPHSVYLETGFAIGYPGMALLLSLFAALVRHGIVALRKMPAGRERRLLLAALAALVGFYLVRGMVESTRWLELLLLTLMLVVPAAREARK